MTGLHVFVCMHVCKLGGKLLFIFDFSDMEEGQIADMEKMGITESFQVKRQVLMSAAEAAEMILRVDNIVKSAPRQRMPDRCM